MIRTVRQSLADTFRTLSLKQRNLLIIWVVVLVSLLSTSMLSYAFARALINDEIDRQARRQVVGLAKEVEIFLNNDGSIAAGLARLAESLNNRITREQYYIVLRKYATLNADTLGCGVWFEPYRYNPTQKYASAYIWKHHGHLESAPFYESAEYDYPAWMWYRIGKNTRKQVVFKEPYFDQYTNIIMVTGNAPFYDANGKLLGVTTADLDITVIRLKVQSLRFGKYGWAFLIDPTGKMIATGGNELALKGTITKSPNHSLALLGRQMLKQPFGMESFNGVHGKTRVYFERIAPTGWVLGMAVPETELYEPLNRLAVYLGLVAVAMLLLGTWISSRVARAVSEPMLQLSAQVQDLTLMYLGEEVDDRVNGGARRGNEIDRLVDDIDRLARTLEVYIADRNRAETALKISEEMYRGLVESINEAFFILTPDGILEFISPYIHEISGFYPSELEGRPVKTMAIQGERDLEQMIREASKSGGRAIELTLRTRAGEWRNLRVALRQLAGAEYQDRIAGVLVDVTEAKRHEIVMNEMRTYLKNVIDSMPSAIIGVDTSLQITQWNTEAETITGKSEAQVLGQPVDQVYPDLRMHLELIRAAIRDKEVQKCERCMDHAAETVRMVDIVVYPLVIGKSERGAVIRIDDATARTHIEEIMIQTEKMISIGGLAAGMAHEINNPVGGIMLAAQNVIRRVSEDLPANQETAREIGLSLARLREYLERRNVIRMLEDIIEMGERSNRIVANMLSFSRRSDALKDLTDLTQVLDATIELARHDYDLKKQYDFRHIEIVRDFETDFPSVYCSPIEIQQVVLNGLKNGAQAMAEKHYDGADNPRIVIRLRRDGEWARIEIEDNGCGMNESIQKRAFEPFFTTRPAGVGTGLGLSVSYFIITNNHKGKMSLESKPGQGTLVVIQIPMT